MEAVVGEVSGGAVGREAREVKEAGVSTMGLRIGWKKLVPTCMSAKTKWCAS